MVNQRALTNAVQNEIHAFVQVLLERGLQVEQVILFGSFAKGTPDRYSDIDLAVISPQFGHDEIAEMMQLARWAHLVSHRIEAIAVSPQLWASRYHPLVGEIKHWGKVVYQSSKDPRATWPVNSFARRGSPHSP